ncbi:hypothetical protein A5680_09695 [Mycobacterium sp. E2989]|nr:hypothetical protein A5680_09695 [Mycobacterium sp. E2989]
MLNLRCLKIFARWLNDEEGFDPTGVLSVKSPHCDEPTVPDLSDDEIQRLLRACDGTSLRDRRDKAMLAMFVETGMRAAEMMALNVEDINISECTVHVVRGKGGRGRVCKYSASTAALLDRYLRSRRQTGQPGREGPLWLSFYGARLGYAGAVQSLKERARAADVPGFHLHRLRHTAATRWLEHGGGQVGLMAQAGWSSPTMVGRYVRAASERLAHAEFDRLGLAVSD